MRRVLLFLLAAAGAHAAEEVVVDFEAATVGKPVPNWTEKAVTFALAEPPQGSA
jgi:hypothetical protein